MDVGRRYTEILYKNITISSNKWFFLRRKFERFRELVKAEKKQEAIDAGRTEIETILDWMSECSEITATEYLNLCRLIEDILRAG